MKQLHREDFFPRPGLPLRILRRNPQPPFPEHTHDFIELVIVTGGKGIHFTREGGAYPVTAGDVFVIREKRMHGYRDLEDLRLVNILFLPELLGSDWEELRRIKGFDPLFTWEPRLRDHHRFENRLRLSPRRLEEAESLLDRVERELEAGESALIVRAAFTLLCAFLVRSYSQDPSPSVQDLHRIGPVLAWLETKLDETPSLEEICSAASLSESSLLRLFRRVTGMPPLAYHIRLRIRRACEELRHSDKPVTQIAFDGGWEDSNYFSRQFKKVMGCSPSEYRKRPYQP